MRFAQRTIAVVLVLGVFALFLTWQAAGQAPAVSNARFETSPLGYSLTRVEKDPEMDKLISGENSAAQDVNRLLADYKGTEKEEERTKIKTKLATALSKQFDMQQKRRELELSRLEAKLKKVRELMKKRDEERKLIIDRRLDQLVREADGLGWAPPPGPRGASRYGTGTSASSPPQAKK
jgi:hypothetical protein